MDKEEREYYYRALKWFNRVVRAETDIIKTINNQIGIYSKAMHSIESKRGRDIATSRLKALNSLKITYTKHYNKKKSLLESLGYNVCNEVVCLDNKFINYMNNWKYIIRNTVDQTDKTC